MIYDFLPLHSTALGVFRSTKRQVHITLFSPLLRIPLSEQRSTAGRIITPIHADAEVDRPNSVVDEEIIAEELEIPWAQKQDQDQEEEQDQNRNQGQD